MSSGTVVKEVIIGKVGIFFRLTPTGTINCVNGVTSGIGIPAKNTLVVGASITALICNIQTYYHIYANVITYTQMYIYELQMLIDMLITIHLEHIISQ